MAAPVVVELTLRQFEALRELCHDGPTNAEIADRLGLSEHTVKSHLKVVTAKTGCTNRTELAIKVLRGRIQPLCNS